MICVYSGTRQNPLWCHISIELELNPIHNFPSCNVRIGLESKLTITSCVFYPTSVDKIEYQLINRPDSKK
ncbi:Hypothetical predicted protein [Octopus vulgaris]|uniref:Uncharacterized protein n=1 Tax=Octopus vulgaris TaxID=6645 RepID=A0AA36AVC5_OCTVU|nr:Hypothetical predicted protein [Octopus vulgaris]